MTPVVMSRSQLLCSHNLTLCTTLSYYCCLFVCDNVHQQNTTYLFRGARPSNTPSLMNVMMELRKCCNHPYLVNNSSCLVPIPIPQLQYIPQVVVYSLLVHCSLTLSTCLCYMLLYISTYSDSCFAMLQFLTEYCITLHASL
jgi:hypothetical protein